MGPSRSTQATGRTNKKTDCCLQTPRQALEASFPCYQPATLQAPSCSHRWVFISRHRGTPRKLRSAQPTPATAGPSARPAGLVVTALPPGPCDPAVPFRKRSVSTADSFNTKIQIDADQRQAPLNSKVVFLNFGAKEHRCPGQVLRGGGGRWPAGPEDRRGSACSRRRPGAPRAAPAPPPPPPAPGPQPLTGHRRKP